MMSEGHIPHASPTTIEEWVEMTRETGILDFSPLLTLGENLVSRTPVKHVSRGWSMIGYHFVNVQVSEDRGPVTIICENKQQAESISSAFVVVS